ncbi:1-acyl-sn-glycerol-3-phosphate acyltransferase [Novosphingobium sp. 1949]|uniref:1-acyl-sn-glycerol-3-phosphate acyltransferase n=1 Tax=Novosphingobium organovorum TaxID=2930092 RepID=A0ABT0BBR9_9SPHN|nr:lysophospholipid acyltransferase family protein [Novosphingobium organovorum]MCJ2182340.1 1-acyl-sn-glycerol-3-phosphate acyltransferase [Novosphingobium organovorum]
MANARDPIPGSPADTPDDTSAIPPPPGPARYPLIALRLLVLLLALGTSLTAYYAIRPFTRSNPVPTRFLRAVAAIAGVRLRIEGARPPRGETCVLVANHVSWLDIPSLAGASGCAFVAHDGLSAIGPLRWLCELNDTVFIARHDRGSIARQVEQVRTALADTGALTIFPEGTTGDGAQLMPFKSSLLSALERAAPGAQSGTIAIRPVWLDYGPEARRIAWLGEESGLANALRLLGRWRAIPLTIHFLEPLTPEQRASRKAIAHNAHAAIAHAMGSHL